MNPDQPSAVDRNELLERVEGDLDLLVALVQAYLSRLSERVSRIEEAVRSRDAATLADAAHTLKGSTANFSRGEVHRISSELEEKGKAEEWGGVDEGYEALERAVEDLRSTLDTVVEEARSGELGASR